MFIDKVKKVPLLWKYYCLSRYLSRCVYKQGLAHFQWRELYVPKEHSEANKKLITYCRDKYYIDLISTLMSKAEVTD